MKGLFDAVQLNAAMAWIKVTLLGKPEEFIFFQVTDYERDGDTATFSTTVHTSSLSRGLWN